MRLRAAFTRERLFLGVGILGLCARAYLVRESRGTNDMPTWQGFGRAIHQHGLGYVYETDSYFNHPPLMGLLAGYCDKLAAATGVRFEVLFKAPCVLADAVSALLVYRYTAQRSVRRAWLAFALFCWSPVSILVTAFHGNTDSICAALALLAAGLVDDGLPLLGGLALGCGLNVKLIPLILIPLLVSRLSSLKDLARFAGGLGIASLTFVPVLIWHGKSYYEHAIAYRSNPYQWGITILLDDLGHAPRVGDISHQLNTWWMRVGASAIVLASVALAAMSLATRRWSARELCACGFALFLVLAPGWGVQYLVYLVPVLFAVRLGHAVLYSAVAGSYAFLIYFTAWTGSHPFFSQLPERQPVGVQAVGYMAWLVTILVLAHLLDFPGIRARDAGRGAVRARHETGMALWFAARNLDGDLRMGTTLALYREACLRFVGAFLVSRDARSDVDSLSAPAALDRFDRVLQERERPAPPEFEVVRLALTHEALDVNRGMPEQGGRTRDALDASARWLSTLIDVRLPRDVRTARLVRVAAAAVLLGYLVIRLMTPTNVALHKPVTASGVAFGTSPSGAVDGDKKGTFGFHSDVQDAPWLCVDLERPFKITKIRVLGRGDCCFDQSIPLVLEVSSDGATYQKLAERTEAFSQADPWVVEPGTTVARFVRLRTERLSALVLSEVEIFGRPGG
jgi:hypothetical protein